MASALLAPAICARAPVKRSNAAQALASATLAAPPHQLAQPGRWPVRTDEELPSLIRSPSALSSSSSLLGSLRELGEWISPQKHSPAARQPKKGQWSLASAVLAPDSPLGLQDVSAAVVLCEGVYRAEDHGEQQAEVAIQRLQRQLPAAPHIRAVQWSPPSQEQRYVVADAGDAIVVAFLGTKRPADHLVNLRLRHSPVFHPSKPSGSLDTASSSIFAASPTSGSSSGGAAPAAHSGYLARAAAVPAEQLYRLARVQGKRLVLTGHSLGGAVATLCAVRLLDALPQELHHTVSCIGFAVPPVGNTALAEAAAVYGWEQRITNYTLPEDFVPGLMGLFGGQARRQTPAAAAAAAAPTPSQQQLRAAATAARLLGPTTSVIVVATSQQHKRRWRPLRRPDLLVGLFMAAVVTLTSSLFSGPGVRLLAAIATLPAHLLPQMRHVGRQISLPGGVVQRSPGHLHAHDPLVPSHVTGRLAAHRMVTYRLRIVHSASGFRASPTAAGLAPERQCYTLVTELTFEVGPSVEPKQLQVALYAVKDDAEAGTAEALAGNQDEGEEQAGPRVTDEFIASGSMSLAQLETVQEQHNARIPLISPAGTHLADLSVDLRFFHTRNPGRRLSCSWQRDGLTGKDVIDQELADAGPIKAAKLVNERSPYSPNSPRRPGCPLMRPPLEDPPVPQLPVALRSALRSGV
ncbi:hypothetical protein ACK3TF_005174 [Chlorella vulgaris]